MSEPSLVVRRDERDTEGKLLPAHLTEIQRVLEADGFAMLPSDTAYSVAAWPRTTRTRRQINELLEREDEPMSLAFSSMEDVGRWTTENEAADRLLNCFTPGPITVVRTASRLISAAFTRELLGSLNHTIGVRIPNSVVERQVAGIGTSAITTVPVLNLTAKPRPVPFTSFPDALTAVKGRIAAFGGAPWCAIEGEFPYPQRSTVVEILGTGRSFTIKRDGFIKEDQIRACIEGSNGIRRTAADQGD